MLRGISVGFMGQDDTLLGGNDATAHDSFGQVGFYERVGGILLFAAHGFPVEGVGYGVAHAENSFGVGGLYAFLGDLQTMCGAFEHALRGRCEALCDLCGAMCAVCKLLNGGSLQSVGLSKHALPLCGHKLGGADGIAVSKQFECALFCLQCAECAVVQRCFEL